MAPSIIATDPGNYVLKRRFSVFFCLVGWGFWWGFFPLFSLSLFKPASRRRNEKVVVYGE